MNGSNNTEILDNSKKLHFVGIGGISMSSLAVLAKRRGYEVTGSDRVKSEMTERLENEGIPVVYNQVAQNVEGCDAVIFTAAMHDDAPELVRARELGIPCFKRAAFLGYLMKNYKCRIGIAGMHGKSTTTSMCAEIFVKAGTDPTIVNGANLKSLSGAYRVGGKDTFIFEACEYTDSFLEFFPSIAVVLNIDREHVDYFKSIEHTVSSFAKYISLASVAVVNRDDENVLKALSGYDGEIVTFSTRCIGRGFEADDIVFTRGMASFKLYRDGNLLGKIKLNVPGIHNVKNALAAAATATLAGIDFEKIALALYEFSGADRRFELIGKKDGVEVRDEYSHHPSEISASLDGVNSMGYKNVWVVFQPHTYSRTKELFEDFVKALSKAQHLILTDIYPAREENVFGVSSAQLAERIENAVYISDYDEIVAYLKERTGPGDLVLTMGAGNANSVGKKFLS